MTCAKAQSWWHRDGLGYEGRDLCFAGVLPAKAAESENGPLYLYDGDRILENLARLTDALKSAGLGARVFYAMKANRNAGVLSCILSSDMCGVDVCSPGELDLALKAGFSQENISYTGTSVSNRDMDAVCMRPGVHFNCDSLSVIRRLGQRNPSNPAGIRVNPGAGLGYRRNSLLEYSGKVPSKFGIYRSRFCEALELAQKYGLRIEGIHFHCGWGYLTAQLRKFDRILNRIEVFLDSAWDIRWINIGGGLGIPLVKEDQPINLELWAGILKKHFAGRNIEVWVEPGDYIVKDSGILVLQVNTVEEKEGVVFAGVNGGFNIHIEPAFYNLPLHVVPCRIRDGKPCRVTIAGNINEALDIMARDVLLPPVEEGDYLAFINAGGYGSSMSSDHCCRGRFAERVIRGPHISYEKSSPE